ncbi:sialidase family protein [Paenibacillus thalictri]|uniref:sialidase family protein n=1 Tax=Paenibacillus thalictri TaxID=2527873 RepID=UPI001F101213|nr:sialidase family protein [Paenibacillus thalictri]
MELQTVHKEFVFEDKRPFLSCHASTLIVLEHDEVLVAWFGGTAEKNSDVAIWISRRQSAGGWGEPVKIADEEGVAHWNPVLFQGADGRIFLFYKVGHEIIDWHTRVMVSTDGGHTWSGPKELVDGDRGGRGPVKNKPILLDSGAIAAPASLERPDPDHPGKEIWEAFADLSFDGGATWSSSGIVPLDGSLLQGQAHTKAKGVIQPALWEDANGLHMLLRSTEGWIYRSDSTDGGATWCTAYPTPLPNNNSGLDVVKTDNGLLALVCNPVQGSGTSSPRSPLTVVFSSDNGESWGNEFILEDGPGEYSYPAVVAKGNRLYITYTWKRERIAFWQMQLRE